LTGSPTPKHKNATSAIDVGTRISVLLYEIKTVGL
jgi:hypothetical protein